MAQERGDMTSNSLVQKLVFILYLYALLDDVDGEPSAQGKADKLHPQFVIAFGTDCFAFLLQQGLEDIEVFIVIHLVEHPLADFLVDMLQP